MATDVMDRKISHVVALCDLNGDGVVEVADFDLWVQRLAAIRGWAPGTDDHAELEALYLGPASDMIAAGSGADRISVGGFSEYLRSLAETDLAAFTAWGDGFFRLIDANADGQIGPDEYADLLASLGIDRAGADAAFSRLDMNADGHISGEEFTKLFLEFFSSDDPEAPGNWFWGPY